MGATPVNPSSPTRREEFFSADEELNHGVTEDTEKEQRGSGYRGVHSESICSMISSSSILDFVSVPSVSPWLIVRG